MPTTGRATSYSDYYKQVDKTPSSSNDDQDEGPSFSFSFKPGSKSLSRMSPKDLEAEDKKKAAIRRRLTKKVR